MLTYADLHNPAITHFGAFLWCADCGVQDSADRADHYLAPDDAPIRCPYCAQFLTLARYTIEVLEK